jgi:5-methylcytosine-specific restriction endonuclease McrA
MDDLEKYKKDILTRYQNRLEYCGGYKTVGSRVIIKCNECGSRFNVIARDVLKESFNGCLKCLGKAKERERETSKVACEEQRRKRIETRTRQREEKNKQREEKITAECSECGAEYVKHNSSYLCCSRVCSNKRRNRLRELRRREAIKNNGKVEYSISIAKLISEWGNCCKLCGGKVDLTDFHIDEGGSYIVGPAYPSVDHIKPVSLGGTHTWDNVQLAHHRCNTLKSDNQFYAEGNQITMAI